MEHPAEPKGFFLNIVLSSSCYVQGSGIVFAAKIYIFINDQKHSHDDY